MRLALLFLVIFLVLILAEGGKNKGKKRNSNKQRNVKENKKKQPVRSIAINPSNNRKHKEKEPVVSNPIPKPRPNIKDRNDVVIDRKRKDNNKSSSKGKRNSLLNSFKNKSKERVAKLKSKEKRSSRENESQKSKEKKSSKSKEKRSKEKKSKEIRSHKSKEKRSKESKENKSIKSKEKKSKEKKSKENKSIEKKSKESKEKRSKENRLFKSKEKKPKKSKENKSKEKKSKEKRLFKSKEKKPKKSKEKKSKEKKSKENRLFKSKEKKPKKSKEKKSKEKKSKEKRLFKSKEKKPKKSEEKKSKEKKSKEKKSKEKRLFKSKEKKPKKSKENKSKEKMSKEKKSKEKRLFKSKEKKPKKSKEKKSKEKKSKEKRLFKSKEKRKNKHIKKEVKKKGTYIGCYYDNRRRMLRNAKFSSGRMTVQKCQKFCGSKKAKFAGLQNRHQCFCGNRIYKTWKRKERDCKLSCKGDRKQKCGGFWRLSVYEANEAVADDEPNLECHKYAKIHNGRCVCKRGYLGDGINSCAKTCTCMASGDPHYKTYDGEMIHFMGTCKYVLTKSKTTDKCAFSVEVKNEHRGRNTKVSFTRMVDVKIYGKTVRLNQNGIVLINSEKKFLPVEENNGQLKVYRTGRYVQVWTECGLEVNFDGRHAVFVSTPPSYRGKLEGICGDCNGKKDDLRTRTGKDVSRVTNKYALIGDSYSVFDDSDDPKTRCRTEDVPFTCGRNMRKMVKDNDVCGGLLSANGRFGACVKAIPQIAQNYYKSCVMDMCSYQGEPKLLHTIKCTSLESFVEECAENGVIVKWRSTSFCPLKCDDANMEYMEMGPGCPATCLDPNAPLKCTVEGREGCFCKKGFVLSDNKCIKQTECGCKDSNGDYYPIGSKKQSADCTSEYVCRATRNQPKFVKLPTGQKCHKHAVCAYNKDGEKACRCIDGYRGDGYNLCIKTVTETETPEVVIFNEPLEDTGDEKKPSCAHADPECSIVVRHGSCGTETIVTGNCVYSHQFSSQCKYSVTTGITTDGKITAKVKVGDGNSVVMSPEDVVKDCATFSIRGAILVINEDMCERCVLEFIRNIGPKNTCPRP